jgi:hypothetical protein
MQGYCALYKLPSLSQFQLVPVISCYNSFIHTYIHNMLIPNVISTLKNKPLNKKYRFHWDLKLLIEALFNMVDI